MGEALAKRVDDRPLFLLANAERSRDGQRHPLCVEERRQIDVPDAIRKRSENPLRELDGEPALAAAADARQREQPRVVEQRCALLDILFMTDETG